MALLEKMWDAITNFVPVDRWVRAIGNVLKWLSLAFILLFGVIFALIVRDWGFTPEQRIGLIGGMMGLILLVLILGIALALLPGGLLYSPYERSLNRGRNFGTKQRPLRRKEVQEAPLGTEAPRLPTQGNDDDKENFPKNRQ